MDEKGSSDSQAMEAQGRSRNTAQSMVDLTRTVLLAGIGAAGLAVDEARAFVDKLVERGEIAENDANKLMDDIRQRSQRQASQTRVDTEKQVHDLLQRMGVPTRADIAELEAKVAMLGEKIDELMAARARKSNQPPGP